MHVELQVDQRDKQKLIEQMREMVPFYTPEWSFAPEAPDPGTALFLLFADMYQGNIDRLNKVPLKYFIEFLNLVGVSPMPPQPAKGFVTFTLTEGAQTPVFLPKGTQISSDKGEDGEEIMFETVHDLMITPAAIKAVYGTWGKRDWVAELPSELYRSPPGPASREVHLIDHLREFNQQAHQFYIGHTELFLVNGPVRLTLQFRLGKEPYREREILAVLADRSQVEWEYYTESGWKAFQEVSLEQGNIVLVKSDEASWAPCEMNGIVSRWLRCTLVSGNVAEIWQQTGGMQISEIRMGIASSPKPSGMHLQPDQLFYNDVELDPASCTPFGEEFGTYSVFYFSCEEAFSKKGGLITLSFKLRMETYERKPDWKPQINWKLVMKKSAFQLPPPQDILIRRVLWEYWNGQTWVPLPLGAEWQELFSSPMADEREVAITFPCPDDWGPVYVNSVYRRWARVRVLAADPVQRVHHIYHAPRLRDISLSYRYEQNTVPIQNGLTVNNLEMRDITALIDSQSEVSLFEPLEMEQPAYYIGFDRPPEKGPICLFVSVPVSASVDAKKASLYWQYFAEAGGYGDWLPVKAEDRTQALTESGIIRFYVTPQTCVRAKRFGRDLYWMRLVLEQPEKADKGGGNAPVIAGLYLNSARIVQQETIWEETPEKQSSFPAPCYQLTKFPVFSEEVWIDERDQISEDEMEMYLAKQPEDIRILRDSRGELEHVWVRWKRVDLFHDSQPSDRHYMINRSNGKIYFGDGIRGKAIPRGKDHAIRVTYKVVAGKKGNLPKGEIKNLQQMFAFVQSVENLVAAGGGCDQETLEEVYRRGPMTLRNRNRAVTIEDFEWLTRQASPNIAKVKCLPHVNSRFEKSTGMVTVVVLPKEGCRESAHFAELKRQVEKYLRERSSNLLMAPDQLQVVLPVFLEISVYAMLVVESMDHALQVEAEAQAILERFLHPIEGNFDGSGWEIGQTIHPSVFYSLLKSNRLVSQVEMLTMTVARVAGRERNEITFDEFEQITYGIITSGKHKIAVVTQ